MVFCLFSSDPVREPGPNGKNHRMMQFNQFNKLFQVGMKEALCKEPACCCFGFLCPCPSACMARMRALETRYPGHDAMQNYACCQGFFDDACCGKVGGCLAPFRGCPLVGLCLEALCCHGCAVSSTRMFVMMEWQLDVDPMDNQIIRFSNCMQCLAVICRLAAMFDESFRDAAELIECIADIVYYATTGCMHAQVMAELKHQGPWGAMAMGSVGVPTGSMTLQMHQPQPVQPAVPMATATAIPVSAAPVATATAMPPTAHVTRATTPQRPLPAIEMER